MSASNGVNGNLTNGHPSSWQAKHDLAPHFIGGNHLEAAPASAVKDFVQKSDGHSVITSVSNGVEATVERCAYVVILGAYCQQWYCRRQRD